jgi:outer membrane lipoprotein-sorting protein
MEFHMMRLRVLALTGCLAAFGILAARAQESSDPKSVLKKAIEAHGGAAKLSKFKAAVSKFKGTMELMGNDVPITGESTFQKPDKLKNTVNIELNGMQLPIVVVYNGKKMWVSVNGQTMEVKEEDALKEIREGLQAEGAGSLVEFLEKPYELSVIGESKVKGKDTIGIRVSKKDQRDFSLFFDKKTHLLVKTEMRINDMQAGQEVTQEKFLTSYRETDGMKTAKDLVIHKDGKLYMTLEITETKMFERLGDDAFQMP